MSYGQNTTDRSEGWICQGDIFARTLDANDKPSDKAEFLGAISSALMSSEIQKIEFKNNKNETSKTYITEKNVKLTLNMKSFHVENYAKYAYADLLQENAVIGYTMSGTVSLGNSFIVDGIISGNVVIKDSTDTTTYVEGDDYRVSNGSIEWMDNGSMTEGQDFNLTYDKAAVDVLEGLVKENLELWLTFDAVNVSEQSQPVKTDFYKCSFSPASQLQILNKEEYGEISIEVDCLASDYIYGAGKSKIFKQERKTV